ncbi:hypothetical protein H7198_04135 [Fructobacillus sp. CRL 2054]|nr:hypothetical protein [Fructobacillus sp. CRL 2054]
MMTIELKRNNLKDDLREYLKAMEENGGKDLAVVDPTEKTPFIYRDTIELIQLALFYDEKSIEFSVLISLLEQRGILPGNEPVTSWESYWEMIR